MHHHNPQDGRVYHRDLWLPPWISKHVIGLELKLEHSGHARHRVADLGGLELPHSVTVTKQNLVELYTLKDWTPYKVLLRVGGDCYRDLCLVISLQNRVLVTAFVNRKDDQHATLDEHGYENPNKKITK